MKSTASAHRGRPFVTDWKKFNLLWRNKSNKEIAVLAKCTSTNVSIRRNKLIAEARKRAVENGKDADRAAAHYTYKKKATV